MSTASRRFLTGLAALLLAGAVIGWFFGVALAGLLVAALVAIAWLTWNLLRFEHALQVDDFDAFGPGRGIWEAMISHFRDEREQAAGRKKAYQMLLREVRKSTNAMPDGAVIIDADNVIIASNRASKELAGVKRKKDRGRRVDSIVRDPALTGLLEGNDYSATVDIRSPVIDDGWLTCRVVPYSGEQKMLILRDATERMRLGKMRRDFVANASHELRSPLTVISGYLDALVEDELLPAVWRKPVRQMRRQATRMKQLLSELLELARLESAGPSSGNEAVDVVALLRAVRESLLDRADVASIRVRPETDVRLHGTAAEIEAVIVNLLSNAIRHTPPEGSISATWRSDEQGAELVVADTGVGIDPQHIPRLTERFFRVDKGRDRDDGGIGLGLAIVKHILSRHDAELVVTSTPGEGSEFCCRFPRERVVVEAKVAVS